MIHTGVYGVGSRMSARSRGSFFMGPIISSQAAVEETGDSRGVSGMHVDVVMAESLERNTFDRTTPRVRKLVRVMWLHERVCGPREDQYRYPKVRRARQRIERMAHE